MQTVAQGEWCAHWDFRYPSIGVLSGNCCGFFKEHFYGN
ncbi:hypothetical protein FM102_01720 [Corynebacterium glutamicum]|nr:hypothetical protein FM102_01720 [Corynebacterium glutamicum]